jgi:hypothetical protein
MAEKEAPKEKDIGQIVRYLTTTFNQATSQLNRPFRSNAKGANQAYQLQTAFAYLLNEVVQGPRCVLQKNIAACNEFIDQVIQDLNQEQASA